MDTKEKTTTEKKKKKKNKTKPQAQGEKYRFLTKGKQTSFWVSHLQH